MCIRDSFDNGVFDSLSLHKILGAEIRTNHAINLFDTLDNSASRFNLLFRYGTFIGGQTSANKKPSTISGEPPVNNYSVSTHIPASDSLDYFFLQKIYYNLDKNYVQNNIYQMHLKREQGAYHYFINYLRMKKQQILLLIRIEQTAQVP